MTQQQLAYNLQNGIAMKCPKCQAENPPDNKFCNECATKLESVCTQCGKANPLSSRFCGECAQDLGITSPTPAPPVELSFEEKLENIQRYLPGGLTEKILAQRGKIEGERKQVTVMFCDTDTHSQGQRVWRYCQ
jgi:predicted amidophosphoribosyltransferase